MEVLVMVHGNAEEAEKLATYLEKVLPFVVIAAPSSGKVAVTVAGDASGLGGVAEMLGAAMEEFAVMEGKPSLGVSYGTLKRLRSADQLMRRIQNPVA